MTTIQKRNYRRKMERMKIATEKEYVDTFFYALRLQKAPVLKQVREHGPLTALIYIDQMNSASLYAAYKKLYYNISPPIAEAEYQRLLKIPEKKGMGFSVDWLADIRDFIENYMLNVIDKMTQLTKERMRDVVVDGIANGDSYDEIAAKLEDTEADRVRARLIARTEVNRATNNATALANKNYPYVVKKEWLAAQDKRTRGNPSPEGVDDKSDHYHMQGQIVDDGQPFVDPRNGAQLNWPGDSTLGAPAANIVNCRCQLLTIPQRDSNGRLIKKDGAKPTTKPVLPTQQPSAVFTPAKNVKEAEQWARTQNLADKIDYSKLSNVNYANSINKALKAALDEHGVRYDEVRVVNQQSKSSLGKIFANVAHYNEKSQLKKQTLDFNVGTFDFLEQKQGKDIAEFLKENQRNKYWVGDTVEDLVNHEIGHFLTTTQTGGEAQRRAKLIRFESINISKYGRSHGNEALAEIWALYKKSGKEALKSDWIDFFNKYSSIKIE